MAMASDGKLKPGGKYRFSLQFGADTPERAQVGEFLKSLGNRKSGVIVAAVAAYLNEHAEILTSGQRPQIVLQTSISEERLREMIRAVVAEKRPGVEPTATPPAIHEDGDSGHGSANEAGSLTAIEVGVTEMLNNLELFN